MEISEIKRLVGNFLFGIMLGYKGSPQHDVTCVNEELIPNKLAAIESILHNIEKREGFPLDRGFATICLIGQMPFLPTTDGKYQSLAFALHRATTLTQIEEVIEASIPSLDDAFW